MAKRSITIAGHRTSLSLEDPFWQALQEIAAARGLSLAGLVAAVDHDRPEETNLSAALRLAALAWYRDRAAR